MARMRWPFSRSGVTKVVGHVEIFDGRILRGWAWDQTSASSRLCLDVFVRDIFAGTARTGRFRSDLASNGIGDGRHAFTFHVPDFLHAPDIQANEIAVFPASADLPRLARISPDGVAEPGALDHRRRTPAAYFAPLVQRIATLPVVLSDWPETGRPGVERLMSGGERSQHATSTFAAHIAAKYGRRTADADFWSWYVEDYAIEKGPARAPLSASDLAAVATLDLAFGSSTYDWVANGARRLFVEDCLIDPAQTATLREVAWRDRHKAFPLSRFMRSFCARNALLAKMPTAGRDDRVAIMTLIMLYALTDAHYLALLPQASVHDLLQTAQGESLFERKQHQLLGCALRSHQYKAHIRRLGFDLDSLTFLGTRYRGHRIGASASTEGMKVDVQLIGPFTRSLGLAESCRRIAMALLATGYDVRLVDYDIGLSGRVRGGALPLGTIGPARLNILHLNAEEAPEAFAYLPGVFTGAHNVMIPYWELNRPSRAHRLGIDLVDEIWAATAFLAEVFSDSGKPVTRIGMGCVDRPGVSRAEARAAMQAIGLPVADKFVFLTTSDALSWMQRKNVLDTIAAFQAAALGPTALLIVKTRNTSGPLTESQRRYWNQVQARCAGDSAIVLLDRDLRGADNQALLAGCDALVSLHRAEGLGLDLLDACARGTPLVTTAYSGPMDFCQDAWRVDFDLFAVALEDYPFVEPGDVWAAPRLSSAVAALREIMTNEPERRRRAEAARTHVRVTWSADALALRLGALIAERLSGS